MYKNRKSRTLMLVARAILAALIPFALITASFPFATIPAGAMCTLSCCVSKAPHASGSCMHGFCQTGLVTDSRSIHTHHELPTQEAQQLCPLHRSVARPNASTLRLSALTSFGVDSKQTRGSPETDNARLSGTTMGGVCEAGCRSCCAASFGNSNRQRNATAVGYASQPRPPSSDCLVYVEAVLTNRLSALSRQYPPRAPPLFY